MNFQVNGDTGEAMTVWRRHQYTKALAPFLIALWFVLILVMYEEHQEEGSEHIRKLKDEYNCVKITGSEVDPWKIDCNSLNEGKKRTNEYSYYYRMIYDEGEYKLKKMKMQCFFPNGTKTKVDFVYRKSMYDTYSGHSPVRTMVELLIPVISAWYVWEVLYLSLYDLLPLQIKPLREQENPNHVELLIPVILARYVWRVLCQSLHDLMTRNQEYPKDGELCVSKPVYRVGLLCLKDTIYESTIAADALHIHRVAGHNHPIEALHYDFAMKWFEQSVIARQSSLEAKEKYALVVAGTDVQTNAKLVCDAAQRAINSAKEVLQGQLFQNLQDAVTEAEKEVKDLNGLLNASTNNPMHSQSIGASTPEITQAAEKVAEAATTISDRLLEIAPCKLFEQSVIARLSSVEANAKYALVVAGPEVAKNAKLVRNAAQRAINAAKEVLQRQLFHNLQDAVTKAETKIINLNGLLDTSSGSTNDQIVQSAKEVAQSAQNISDCFSEIMPLFDIESTHGVRVTISYIFGALVFFGVIVTTLVLGSKNDSLNECTKFDDNIWLSRDLMIFFVAIVLMTLVMIWFSIPQWRLLWSVVNLEALTQRYEYYFAARMKFRRSYFFSTRSMFHWLVIPFAFVWCPLCWFVGVVAAACKQDSTNIMKCGKLFFDLVPSSDSLHWNFTSSPLEALRVRLRASCNNLTPEEITAAANIIYAYATNPDLTSHILRCMSAKKHHETLNSLTKIPDDNEDAKPLKEKFPEAKWK